LPAYSTCRSTAGDADIRFHHAFHLDAVRPPTLKNAKSDAIPDSRGVSNRSQASGRYRPTNATIVVHVLEDTDSRRHLASRALRSTSHTSHGTSCRGVERATTTYQVAHTRTRCSAPNDGATARARRREAQVARLEAALECHIPARRGAPSRKARGRTLSAFLAAGPRPEQLPLTEVSFDHASRWCSPRSASGRKYTAAPRFAEPPLRVPLPRPHTRQYAGGPRRRFRNRVRAPRSAVSSTRGRCAAIRAGECPVVERCCRCAQARAVVIHASDLTSVRARSAARVRSFRARPVATTSGPRKGRGARRGPSRMR
jgi:hypothetical protein